MWRRRRTRRQLRAASTETAPPPQDEEQQKQQSLNKRASTGRRWKNRRKEQTFLPAPIRSISTHDEDALHKQLGYVPPNVCCISARTSDRIVEYDSTIIKEIDTSEKGVGRPVAIMSYPLIVQLKNKNSKNEDKKEDTTIPTNYNHAECHSITPFPTIYWLTCSHISRAISELEGDGYVTKFQEKLESDKLLAQKWWDCHEEYAKERYELLSEHDKSWLDYYDTIITTPNNEEEECNDQSERKKRQRMKDILYHSGVAGTDHKGLREQNADKIDNFVPSVKCMHSHYAHYRSQLAKYIANGGSKDEEIGVEIAWNLVGKWTHELLLSFPDLVL